MRGGYRAEASQAVYNNACACNWASTDASNKGSGLGSLSTDADRSRVARPSRIADIDVAVASGEICTGIKAQGDVAAARCVVKERAKTVGGVVVAGVVVAGVVVEERVGTGGRVSIRGGAGQGSHTDGGVVKPVSVGRERFFTASGVADANSVVEERTNAVGCVVVTGCVECQRSNTGGRVGVAGGVALERRNTRGGVVVAGLYCEAGQ